MSSPILVLSRSEFNPASCPGSRFFNLVRNRRELNILEWITRRSSDNFFLQMSFQHPDIIPSIKILSRSWSEIFWISLNQVLVCSVWYYWLLASDRGGSLSVAFMLGNCPHFPGIFFLSVYYFYFTIFGISITLISHLQSWDGELHIFWRRGQERVLGGSEKWERDSNPCFIPSK